MDFSTIKGSYTNGLFVPTHRKVPVKVLESLIREARIAKYDYSVDTPVIIMDDAKTDEVYRHNRDLLSVYNEKNTDIDIFFVSKKAQNGLVKKLQKDLDLSLHLLEGKDVNYGTIFNTLFFIGQAMGISVYHRRDSDVFIQQRDKVDYAPVTKELDYINKEYEGQNINIVGGNYLDENGNLSDTSLRLDECMKTPDFLKRFMQCIPANDMEVLEELGGILEGTNNCENPHTDDTVAIAAFGSANYVDCGNVCFTEEAYRTIPSAPNDLLIGSDYHMFNIAKIAGMGILSHNRRVLHHKMEIKSAPDQHLKYWQNMYNFCDSEFFHFYGYSDFQEKIASNTISATDRTKTIRTAFADSLTKAREAISEDHRLMIMEKLSEALTATGCKIYMQIAEQQKKAGYDTYLDKGLSDLNVYIELLDRWEDIVEYFD